VKDIDFEAFPKIPRLRRNAVVTEKIDGTNAQVFITECLGPFLNDGETRVVLHGTPYLVRAGSRNRWLTREADNFGFAAWVEDHADELVKLGPGRHFGEWYGLGIQRGYGLDHKRFALFNTGRWFPKSWGSGEPVDYITPGSKAAVAPDCCDVVPVLRIGTYSDSVVELAVWELQEFGSRAVPGFMMPEGVVVYHTASRQTYKRLIEGDDRPKSLHEYVPNSHSESEAA
jgi:hypothetical protein